MANQSDQALELTILSTLYVDGSVRFTDASALAPVPIIPGGAITPDGNTVSLEQAEGALFLGGQR